MVVASVAGVHLTIAGCNAGYKSINVKVSGSYSTYLDAARLEISRVGELGKDLSAEPIYRGGLAACQAMINRQSAIEFANGIVKSGYQNGPYTEQEWKNYFKAIYAAASYSLCPEYVNLSH